MSWFFGTTIVLVNKSKIERGFWKRNVAVESSIKHFMTVEQDDVLQMVVHGGVEEVEKGR